MKGMGPGPRTRVAGRVSFEAVAAGLLRNSLVAYLAVELLSRTWAMLNMDLLQLFRKL